jgi:hypothetical protein
MSKADDSEESNKNKPTVGEELFLVHLRRCRQEEEDHDHLEASARKRSPSTVGEELWEVHLKRSRGLGEHREEEETLSSDNGSHEEKKAMLSSATAEEPKCRRYNLRSKDASPKKLLPTLHS